MKQSNVVRRSEGTTGLIFCESRSAGLKQLFGRLLNWRIGSLWWLACLPFIFYGVSTVVAGATGSFTFNFDSLHPLLFGLGTGFIVTLLLRGPMGEELGLRGFALPHLQQRMSPIRASVIIGILWTMWHLPVLIDQDLLSIISFLLLAFLL